METSKRQSDKKAGIQSDTQNEASQFFLKNYRYVRRIAFMNAPQRDLADDIVNDVFLEFTQINHLDFDREPLHLLGSITRNIALRYWHEYVTRRTSPQARLAEWVHQHTLEEQARKPDESLEEELSAMMNCLDKLPEEHQQILILHYFKGLSFTEVAVIVHKKLMAVLKIASRLRARLRQCVEISVTGNDREGMQS